MFDQFKFSHNIRFDELERIESPVFAHAALERLASTPGSGSFALQHLYRDYLQQRHGHQPNRKDLLSQLHQAIDDGRLVYLCKRPQKPVLHWQSDADAPRGGHWQFSDGKPWRLHALDQHIRNTQTKASQHPGPNNQSTQISPATPPSTRTISHSNVTPQPVAPATPSANLRLSNAVWSRTRVPVGQAVHACFTAHDAQGGESATLSIFETNADGSQTEVDTLNVTLEAGTQRYNLEWTRSEDKVQMDVQQDMDENDSGPVSYGFEVKVNNATITTDKPLHLTTTLIFKTSANFHHDLALLDAEQKLYTAQVKQGELRFENVTLGPWRLHSSTPWYSPPALSADASTDAHFQHAAMVTPKMVSAVQTLHHNPIRPPVIVNLREDAPAGDICTRKTLTAEELDYFKQNGNNAVVYIHGFNVPYGEFGKVAALQTLKGVIPIETPFFKKEVHWKILKPYYLKGESTIYRDLDTLKRDFPALASASPGMLHKSLLDEDELKGALNGSGAHSWIVHLEHNLNRAAGMVDGDYSNYSRIVQVCWSGDVFPVNYMQAELNATMAGGNLIYLLKQLIDAGININLIAHSLGSRVLLVALNELGNNAKYKEKIKHAFMWQPATPDTALSNDPLQDTSILQNWHFPHAHAGAQKLVILYSEQDNILGPYTSLKHGINDLLNGQWDEAIVQDIYGAATEGIKLGEYGEPFIYSGTPVKDKSGHWFWAQQQWRDGWQRLGARRREAFIKAMQECQSPQMYVCGPEAASKAREIRVRPAMGWKGVNPGDPFTNKLESVGKIVQVNQTDWLYSHSGMKIPTEKLFEEIITKQIMQRIHDEGGGFGLY